MVVYHLQGETGWSTVCANGKQNLPNGKYRPRLACTICTVHSDLQRVWTKLTIGAGPRTGTLTIFRLDIPVKNFRQRSVYFGNFPVGQTKTA